METAVANLVGPGIRVLSVVTGYFADRLAQMCCTRYGGSVMRGAPARAIQELAGHKDLSMTQHFMHLSPAALG